MKLGRVEQKVLGKGDKIVTRAGRKYVIVRVSGSTVTCERIPTTLESVARALGIVAGVCRAAYRNARYSVAAAAARSKKKHRPDL